MSRRYLTPQEKLSALAARFYQRVLWQPKAGDYYTTSRADYELYKVVDVREDKVFTIYCDPAHGDHVSEWPEDEFLAPHTFGYARTWVPEWCFADWRPAHPAFRTERTEEG